MHPCYLAVVGCTLRQSCEYNRQSCWSRNEV